MATNRDVTLRQNGVNVYPRTFSHNIYYDDGKTTIVEDLAAIKDHDAQLIDHQARLLQQATDIVNLQAADRELSNRISSLEETKANHEGRISSLEGTAEALSKSVQTNTEAIANINKVIPTNASESNKLAAESYVNDAINQIGAYYITNAQGEAFATKADFDAAVASGELYSGGEVRIPQRNDYALVLEDETRGKTDADDTYPTTRYIFDEQWEFQYVVNNTTLKQEQLDAINSGITAELVGKIGNNIERLDAAEGRLDTAEGRLDTVEGNVSTLTQTVTDNKTATDEAIANINNRIDNGLVGDLGGLDTRLTAVEKEINGIPADETAGTEEVVGIKGRLDAHDSDIQALRTAIDEKQADLTAGQYVTITEDENGSQVIDIVVDDELSLDSTNPVSNSAIKNELDKKVECTDEVEFDVDIEYVTMSNRVATLEAQVAQLLSEVEALKALHNGGSVTPEGTAPTVAPANVTTSNTDISFDEVEGAEGYNVYVDGEHKQTI